jgi:NAD(P)H dehydrogenase (quinone)
VNVLVVQAHPAADGFNAALLAAALDGLEQGGHHVRSHRLYAEGFRAAMSSAERVAYHGDQPVLDPLVAEHVADLRWAEALVLIFPTWWSGLPAILKGWLERVMVPGVAFRFDDATHKVTANLTHIRRIVGVSTYGATHARTLLVNDAGRRTVLRAVRMLCHRRARSQWLALYSMDDTSDADRAAFLARVAAAMRAL